MEKEKRLYLTWRTLYTLLKRPILHHCHFTPEYCEEKGPLLVMCNHVTDWDPLLLGTAFPHTYLSFVASEHIFRWGFLSKVICWLLDPIARMKGTTAGDTALTMMRKMKKGTSVAIFAEGNRSFNGLTMPILPATGKLARSSGATLVTYRFTGGYFTSPRWSGSKIRKGKMRGQIVNIYSPEQLKAMKPAEVNAAIAADLFEDAYATQRREMTPFYSDAPAEHLETVLCRCPKCGKLDTLHSHGDTLSCDCGFSVRYNEYGFFEGEDAPFDNITDWDAAQSEALIAAIPNDGSPIFSDTEMILREVTLDHSVVDLGQGEITLYADRFVCCGMEFPLSELGGFSLHGKQSVNFSHGGKSYEIRSEQIRCTRKYMTIIEYLKANENSVP